MAFDINEYLKQKGTTQTATTSFNVNDFLRQKGYLKPDLATAEGLATFAKKQGLEDQVNKILDIEGLSTLQRLGKGLGAFNPAEAILTGVEKGSVLSGIGEYAKDVVTGIGSAITGTDYEPNRRTFVDAVEALGVENSIAKFGLGVVADIFLDPSTYFGGAFARAGLKGISGGTNIALKTVGRVAPEVETAARGFGTALKDTVGKAFKYGYGTSKGLPEQALEIQSKLAKTKEGIVMSNLERLGTGTLSESQQAELVNKLLAGKRTEFGVRESARKIALTADEFMPISNKLNRMIETRGGYISDIQKEINKLEKTGLKLKLGEELTPKPESLVSGIKTKTVSDTIKFGPNDVPTGAGSEGYTKLTDIPAVSTNRGEQSTKAFIESLITDPNKDVAAIKRMVATRENNLSGLFDEIASLKNEYQTIQNLKYRRLQLADTTYAMKGSVAKQAATSADPLVQKTIEEQSARSQKFATQAGIQDPFEIYFPGLKNDQVTKFLESTRSLRVGSQGYLKQFKNLLTDEQLISNPAEAFAKQEFKIAKDAIVADEKAAMVRDFGKPLDAFVSEEAAKQAGYRLVKTQGVFGKTLGYLNESDYQFIENLVSPETITIDKIAKATGYDAITSLFKRSVTGLFASFHVRNYVSGLIQNFEVLGWEAIKPSNIAAGQKMAFKLAKGESIGNYIIKVAGKDLNMGKAFKAFEKRFGTSSSYISDIADATKGAGNIPGKLLSKESAKETLKTLGLGQQSIPFRTARAVGNFIETQQKATAFITALNQGKNIDEALELATRAGFDYRALTNFESKILRRIFPFYSFTKNNILLQLKTIGENPQRINQILAVANNIGERATPEEKRSLPQYLRDSIGIKLSDTPSGLKQYISSLGTPLESFSDIFNRNPVLKAISQMNPLLKVPIEIGTGKDSFRQKDLKDVYDAKEYAAAPKIVKDLLQIVEVKKPILKKNKQGKLVKTGEYTQYVADPERLLIARSLFTSRGITYLNQVFNGDVKGLEKAISLVTGVKTQTVDIEQQKGISERDRRRALEDYLQRLGKVQEYKRVFVPKK